MATSQSPAAVAPAAVEEERAPMAAVVSTTLWTLSLMDEETTAQWILWGQEVIVTDRALTVWRWRTNPRVWVKQQTQTEQRCQPLVLGEGPPMNL